MYPSSQGQGQTQGHSHRQCSERHRLKLEPPEEAKRKQPDPILSPLSCSVVEVQGPHPLSFERSAVILMNSLDQGAPTKSFVVVSSVIRLFFWLEGVVVEAQQNRLTTFVLVKV